MKHQKHAKLKRANYGKFGRNEWAIIGTPCNNLKKIAFALTEVLHKHYKLVYLDADHRAELPVDSSAIAHGADLECTNKINRYQFVQKAALNNFQLRQAFNLNDIILVNGNHFIANQQIVVIDSRKEDSLKKKLDQLTNVQLLLIEGDAIIPEYLRNHLGKIGEIPIFQTTDIEKINTFLLEAMKKRIPKVKGLVLAGGRSQRMGKDKGDLNYYGVSQRDYLMNLLDSYCEKVYLSCREDQVNRFSGKHPVLSDKFIGLGPFGAILSAFQEDPDMAWLVVACDLPFVNTDVLECLLENRAVSEIATAFHNVETGFPDPLVALWEPRSYPILLQFLAMGYSCPRKVLINSPIKEITPPSITTLTNVNTPKAYQDAMNLIIDQSHIEKRKK